MTDFAARITLWQRRHGRHDLPWQGMDAYRIWLSEIMLQQTQVATVIPYYQRFIASFPNISALAAAAEEQVLAHWSGLGYYARGRNLHRAARLVAEKYQGVFPVKYEQILELPGIGRSTAAAICALAYFERRAILDGNVRRVLARYCGIHGRSAKIEQQLWQQAEALLPQRDIAGYTQALMDMGATLCKRGKPECTRCPVQSDCVAWQSDLVHMLPTPRQKKALPEKYATFLLILRGNDILLEKRSSNGIWGGLWCLPQFDDSEEAWSWCRQQGIGICHTREGGNPDSSTNQCEALPPFTHTFTHFRLHITPLLLRVNHMREQHPGRTWLDRGDALQSAIPTPVRSLLQGLGSKTTTLKPR